ncbi:type II secretion system F family protein [Acetobacter estunensis]|uniref:type II secretion system F family protein n=1 Tax=Acetobacter estunensis TaxID=104097 RepID=UPI001C2D8969|nr:type II secretion system F family protein [Acetobacter estunensis]MBV1836761.1 type II secretion system F family protein [Acetobacter estunensis]
MSNYLIMYIGIILFLMSFFIISLSILFKNNNKNIKKINRIKVVVYNNFNESSKEESKSLIISKINRYDFVYNLLEIIVGVKFNAYEFREGYIRKFFTISFAVFFGVIVVVRFVAVYIFKLKYFLCFLFIYLILLKIILMRKYGIYKTKLIEQLPDAVFMMSRSLKIGISLPRSLEIVARQAPQPTKNLFESVVESISVGKDLSESLDEMSISSNVNEYKFFSIIVGLQSRTGGGLSEVLDSFAGNVRKKLMARKKAIALASEARLSCYVLMGMPIFMLFMLYFVDKSYLSVFFDTSSGLFIFMIAGILFFLGVGSMFAIIKVLLR